MDNISYKNLFKQITIFRLFYFQNSMREEFKFIQIKSKKLAIYLMDIRVDCNYNNGI